MVPNPRRTPLKARRSRHPSLQITHPNAAGIDIGSAAHYVAVPPDRDEQPVREFKNFTADLIALADWLKACTVDTVAMESTGVYWIPLFELLESRGFTVFLVNARHVKNVSGRKSDVSDCQWLQQLMSYGLLSGAFRPADAVCVLRSYCRQRGTLLRDQAREVLHMQKALTQMNLQLANVISDVVGETVQRILRAIVAGERNGQKLASLRDGRIHASEEEIAKSLLGNWREEHLFALEQSLARFDFIGTQLSACDQKIEQQLATLQAHDQEPPPPGRKLGHACNAPKFDVRARLFAMCGVDLTRINGIDVSTALAVIAETGADLSRFPTAVHFASWLGLSPGTRITGGKVMRGKSKRVVNRAAQALRQTASSLRSSKSALGAYYRRLCGRMDKAKAITCAAHKLATLIYALLTRGEEYVDRGQAHYEEHNRQLQLTRLTRQAEALGMTLVAKS